MRAVSSLLRPHNGFSQTRVRAAEAAKVKKLSGFFWAFWPARCVKENSLDLFHYLQNVEKTKVCHLNLETHILTISRSSRACVPQRTTPRAGEDPSDPVRSEINLTRQVEIALSKRKKKIGGGLLNCFNI